MISVTVVDNNPTYKTALVTYLQKAPDITVPFTGGALSDLPQLLTTEPDVVIMDIALEGRPDTEAVRQIKEALPSTEIIILTALDDEDKIFSCLSAGANGYLLKKDPHKQVLEAIRSVHRGEGVLNGTVARKVLSYFQKPVKTVSGFKSYHLTTREQEILLLLMDGLSYKEIAARCFVSIDTVNTHIRKIYTKLNVRSRAEINARFR